LGILGSDELAVAAIPKSHLVYLDGDEMKAQVSGYLKALYDVNPELVGGVLPGSGFYYIPRNLPTPDLPPIPTPTPTPTPEPEAEVTDAGSCEADGTC
jgi:hypothetical protein